MKCFKKVCIYIIVVLIILSSQFRIITFGSEELAPKSRYVDITPDNIENMDKFIKQQIDSGKIPGLSVGIVHDNKVLLEKGYGFKDLNQKRKAGNETLYSLGTGDEIFTALAVMDLQDKGMLDLRDTVLKYFPQLKMKYQGREVEVTIEQLVNQTSGIGEDHSDYKSNKNGFDMTKLKEVDLANYPGSIHENSSINYIILSEIVKKLTGEECSEYIKKSIMKPAGMINTQVENDNSPIPDRTVDYKISFGKPRPYTLPKEYSGLLSRGFVTSIKDMSQFLLIQTGNMQKNGVKQSVINRSHVPDRTVPPGPNGTSYACGWYVLQDGGGELFKTWNTPGASGYITFRPLEKTGVVVLANLNSANTEFIGRNLMNMLVGKPVEKSPSDMNIKQDDISTLITVSSSVITLVLLVLLIIALTQVFLKKRTYKKMKIRISDVVRKFFITALFMVVFGGFLINLPEVFFQVNSWEWVFVWAPFSFSAAVASAGITAVTFLIYFIFVTLFPKPNSKSLFLISILSILSGLGNALSIVIINQVLVRKPGNFHSGLLFVFLVGLVIYIFGQKKVRSSLIDLTNEIVFSKRMELADKILRASYQSVEKVDAEKIQTGLNYDTEIVSGFAGIFVTGLTSLITVICCFIYIGFISIYGLILSILVTLIAAGLYYFAASSANKLWEQCRDIQNVFVNYIYHITGGFKELSINRKRMEEFKEDLRSSSVNYRMKRQKAEFKFMNVFILGELLITSVIAIIVFVFPIALKDTGIDTIRNFVLIFFYVCGPIYTILGLIPGVMQVRICWNRIRELTDHVESLESKEEESFKLNGETNVSIELKGVVYKYDTNDEKPFSVGPVDCTFNSGEITFITGGNGSGKSTVAKLITGLYKPQEGHIFVNGREINPESLGQLYSVIFSDFFLFKKLYGIDFEAKKDEIEKYLKVLRIDDKLEVSNGAFSTTSLSTGQRKRMALLVSFLEDKPVCLFDEWAADQDPLYRKYFYNVILPELKARGKCIVAITHDDAYFHVADRVIKMEMGRVVEYKVGKEDESKQETA